MGYNLLINGVYWGYNPLTNLLLTSCNIPVAGWRVWKGADLERFGTLGIDQIPNLNTGATIWSYPPGFDQHMFRSKTSFPNRKTQKKAMMKNDAVKLDTTGRSSKARWFPFVDSGAWCCFPRKLCDTLGLMGHPMLGALGGAPRCAFQPLQSPYSDKMIGSLTNIHSTFVSCSVYMYINRYVIYVFIYLY